MENEKVIKNLGDMENEVENRGQLEEKEKRTSRRRSWREKFTRGGRLAPPEQEQQLTAPDEVIHPCTPACRHSQLKRS